MVDNISARSGQIDLNAYPHSLLRHLGLDLDKGKHGRLGPSGAAEGTWDDAISLSTTHTSRFLAARGT